MKKIIMAVAVACTAILANAAAVGWTNAGMSNYAGNAYALFVIGQKGVANMSTVTDLLDAGGDYASFAFGSGKVAANGTANLAASTSSPQLDAGTYTSFFVLFSSESPTAGDKYVVVSGLSGQTQTIGATTAKATFATLNQSAIYNNTANWKSFGSAGPAVPEPTSGLLLLLGMAGLALKRKVA